MESVAEENQKNVKENKASATPARSSKKGSANQPAAASTPAPIASTVIDAMIATEIKSSFLSYAMSVIVSRALPDVRDGLKPVHRRILYAMHDLGMGSTKPPKKSARIVGEVIGKYHPHGDTAVYDSMVRMAQDFSLRYMLVQGQGNFGSVDGDSPAAMRYTEARLSKAAEEMLLDLDKETVKFAPNYDEQLEEPTVLPAKLPNLLINGSVGIAVGMATNVPPHNLTEVGSAVIALIEKPELESVDLMEYVKGPDFPTKGIIYGKLGLYSAYKTGHGRIIVRARLHEEEVGSRHAIIIDEIPYQVNKSNLIEEIAQLVRDKVIEGIHDIRDESDRDGMRVVIELKKDAVVEIIINQLFKHSRLQVTVSIMNLCLVNNIPRILTLKEIIQYFIDHRFIVVTKRTQFELKKAEERAHILLGLKTAIDNLDKAIELIKKSPGAAEAKIALIAAFPLDEIQAQAILDMRLQRLTGLERNKIVDEHKGLLATISELQSILASKEKIFGIIKTETKDIVDRFGDARKTEIVDADMDIEIEDLIEDRDDVVTITHEGYIKRVSLDTYRSQKRGGRGIVGTTTKDTDFVEKVFVAHTKSSILFFTNKGQVHWLKVYQVPEGARQAKGKAIVNLLSLQPGERVTTAIPVKTFDPDKYLILCTKQGTVKKSSLQEFANPRNGGIRAIKLVDDDELIKAELTDGKSQVILATKLGIAIRFDEADAREVGRVSQGVRGIKLDDGDEVIGMVIADDSKTLLTITGNGYGKRTAVSEYRLIGRGGKGVINIQTTDRNGGVVAILPVDDETGVLFMSKNGITLRTRADGISVIGRNTQGVRLMRLEETDLVVSATMVPVENEIEAIVEAAVESTATPTTNPNQSSTTSGLSPQSETEPKEDVDKKDEE